MAFGWVEMGKYVMGWCPGQHCSRRSGLEEAMSWVFRKYQQMRTLKIPNSGNDTDRTEKKIMIAIN